MGAIQVAKLLQQERTSQEERSLERTWQTKKGSKSTLCHIRPSVSLDPKDRKIQFMVRADLDAQQCREIGDHLICLAEYMQEFSQPIRPAERKVVGRSWNVESIGERKRDNRGRKLFPRAAFLTPMENGRTGEWYVSASCVADLTPRMAREMGAYLLALAAQI